MTVRLRNLLCLSAAVASIAGAALAQTGSAPLTVKDGQSTPQPQTLCEYKVDGANMAGCQVKWVWTGTAWVLEPVDANGHEYVNSPQNFQAVQYNGASGMVLAAAAAYGQATALCTSATVATCNSNIAGYYFTLATGTMHITGGSIRINDSLSTGWAQNAQVWMDLFSAAATLNAGDGGAYKIATGTANYVGSLLCTSALGVQGDGVNFKCTPVGGVLDVNLGATNAHLFATFETLTGSGAVTAGSTLYGALTGTY